MLSLILTIAMTPSAAVAPLTAQVTTCQWPNKCVSAPVAVQPCVWPNRCVEAAPLLPVLTAQVTTCQWPHTCSSTKA